MIFIKPNIALLLFTFFAQTYSVEGESKLPIVGFVVCIVFSLASFASIRSYIGTHQYGMKNYEQYNVHNSNFPTKKKLNKTDSTEDNIAKATLEFRKHYFELEKEFGRWIPSHWDNRVPTPFSVKIIDDRYYVLISIFTIPSGSPSSNNHTNPAAFTAPKALYCNHIKAEQVKGKSKISKHGTKDYLLVQCPKSLKASVKVLSTFTIEINEEFVGLNETATTEFDVKKLVEAEQADIKLSSLLKTRKDIKLGLSATFSGGRDKLLEWVTYHLLTGIDHIWLYVNEPWANGTDLPLKVPDVTFIPYDNKFQNCWKDMKTRGHLRFMNSETWRANSQNDGLWRAKRMNMDWMIFLDIDEFVVSENQESKIPNVKEYLKQFNVTSGGQYSSIYMKSVPHGQNKEFPNPGNLMLNFTWRPKGNPEEYGKHRGKIIVDVKKVDAVAIHYILSRKHMVGDHSSFMPRYKDIRINHYKNPRRGAFSNYRENKYFSTSENLEESPMMRDKILNSVLKQMNSSML